MMHARLADQAKRWDSIVKIGRTHLQDATPLTLGQEFSGYAAQIADCIERVEGVLPRVMIASRRAAPRSAPASTRPRASPRTSPRKSRTSPSCRSRRRPTSSPSWPRTTRWSSCRACSTSIAVALTKIANDIRLLGSGPRCGLGELKLPENEPGSSIMPGKVNPTQAEMLTMVAAQVMGNHVAVTVGGLQGHLELNVFKPLIGANVIRSINLLAIGMESFTERMLDGAEPDEQRIAELMNRSLMLVTALAPEIGYDNAAAIAKHAHKNG